MSAERRAMSISGELEELRTQLEAAERARKAAEAELHETSDRVSELAAANNSLVTSKRKLEIDIQAMQVLPPPPPPTSSASKCTWLKLRRSCDRATCVLQTGVARQSRGSHGRTSHLKPLHQFTTQNMTLVADH